MQYKKTQKDMMILSNIINKTKSNLKAFLLHEKCEEIDYNQIDIETRDIIANILNDKYKGLTTSIHDDIFFMNRNIAIMGNVYQNLKRETLCHLLCFSEDEFSKVMVNALKMSYFIEQYCTLTILMHLNALFPYIIKENKDETITNTVCKRIAFINYKYRIDGKNKKSFFRIMENYMLNDIYKRDILTANRAYIDDIVKKTIDSILKFGDRRNLNIEEETQLFLLQCLLRAIFLLIDDYHELVEYESYYNLQAPQETKAKDIVRKALIAHYNDANNVKLKSKNC